MKKFIVLISMVFLLNISTAFAQEQEKSNGLYVKAFGGLSSWSDSDVEADSGGSADLKTESTFGVGAEIGMNSDSGFAVGLEYSYRNFDGDSLKINNTNIVYNLEGEAFMKTLLANIYYETLLANIYYEYDLGNSFKPYVGAGLGLAWVEDAKNTEFASQVTAGLAYEATDNIDLFGGYKYLSVSDVEHESVPVTVEVDVHNFEVGIKYSF